MNYIRTGRMSSLAAMAALQAVRGGSRRPVPAVVVQTAEQRDWNAVVDRKRADKQRGERA